MTMAQDSSPPPGALAEETIEMVRSALARYLDGSEHAREGVRDALHVMAREARDKGIMPVQLLITLKDVWFSLPRLKTAPDHQRSALLQRVVTICIKEYYGD